jgi:hypothetical protein
MYFSGKQGIRRVVYGVCTNGSFIQMRGKNWTKLHTLNSFQIMKSQISTQNNHLFVTWGVHHDETGVLALLGFDAD